MEALRLWWNTTPDFQWIMQYHRSHPLLRHTETLMSAYGVFYALLCGGLLLTPGQVVGGLQRTVVLACGGVALIIAIVSIQRRIDSKRASISFIIGSDVGMAAVLLSMSPSPFALLATSIFTGIGNYAASFHGAKVFVAQYVWMLVVLATLTGTALWSDDWPLAAVLTAAGTAFIVLFTSSVIMQALVTQLRHDAAGAYYDPLTGLRNRRGLLSATNELVLDRPGALAWTVVIDLDGFKTINDRHGHDHGDRVLRRTAARIEASAPSPMIAARVGGEEFTVVGVGSARDASDCADRILRSMHERADDIPVTASLGVATRTVTGGYAELQKSFAGLAARADAAMYDAKRQGGDRVVHADLVQP